MTNWHDRELTLLAQAYANACAVRTDHSPKLYELMALQFTPVQLGRLSRYFGFAPLYEAVIRSSPQKGFDFQLNSDPSLIAPTPRQISYSGNRVLPINNAGTPPLGPLGPYIGWADSTPYDIYLTFRTSPALGLLSVSSSLTATVAVYGIAANLAWGIGWHIGTPLGQFIQWVSPSLWDDIGGTINQIFENWGIDLSSAPTEDAQVAYTGVAEAAIADAFAMPVPEQSFLQETGGDYGAFAPWSYDTFDYPDYSWDSVANQFGSYGTPNYCEYCAWP